LASRLGILRIHSAWPLELFCALHLLIGLLNPLAGSVSRPDPLLWFLLLGRPTMRGSPVLGMDNPWAQPLLGIGDLLDFPFSLQLELPSLDLLDRWLTLLPIFVL